VFRQKGKKLEGFLQKFPTGREKVAGNLLLERRIMEGIAFPRNPPDPVEPAKNST
jgi:hypothetical protein